MVGHLSSLAHCRRPTGSALPSPELLAMKLSLSSTSTFCLSIALTVEQPPEFSESLLLQGTAWMKTEWKPVSILKQNVVNFVFLILIWFLKAQSNLFQSVLVIYFFFFLFLQGLACATSEFPLVKFCSLMKVHKKSWEEPLWLYHGELFALPSTGEECSQDEQWVYFTCSHLK